MAAMKDLLVVTMDRLEAQGVPADQLEEKALELLEEMTLVLQAGEAAPVAQC